MVNVMANDVFANGREIACKSASGKTIASFPDVCFTPPECPATPPGVPTPYAVNNMASDSTEGSKDVTISGKEVMLKDRSYLKAVTGDEAGCATKKGMINSKNTGKGYFTSWSMDVKIEGENVVRHFDLTTNNHACKNANAAIPWPYMDSVSLDNPDNACNESGDAKKVNDNCSRPPEDDYTDNCCAARKCMLVPWKPNKCCPKEEGKKQNTPHHIVPKSQFYEPGYADKSVAGRLAGALLTKVVKDEDGNDKTVEKYSPEKAPCICEEGTTHSGEDEHAEIHTETNVSTLEHASVEPHLSKTKRSINKKARWDVGDAESIGAQATSDVTKCDKKCLEAQVRAGHAKMGIGEKDKIRPTTAGRTTRPPKDNVTVK
jgi:hypothetical protein